MSSLREWFITLTGGAALFSLFVLTEVILNLSPHYGLPVAFSYCWIAAFAGGWIQGGAGECAWRVGFGVSWCFWAFLGIVFLALLADGELAWRIAIEAVAFAGGSAGSAILGGRLARAYSARSTKIGV